MCTTLVSESHAAALLGVSLGSLRQMTARGQLRPSKPGFYDKEQVIRAKSTQPIKVVGGTKVKNPAPFLRTMPTAEAQPRSTAPLIEENEACSRLGVDPDTLRNLTARGAITFAGTINGGPNLYVGRDVDELLERRRQAMSQQSSSIRVMPAGELVR